MKYILKHKNVDVLQMELDEETFAIIKIDKVIHADHIPFGVRYEREILDRKALNDWLKGRSIPASRDNIDTALQVLGETNTQHLITKCFGLSLSDCYWICPANQPLDFNAINFFENDFSGDMGEILFGKQLDEFSLLSPDNTSDGWLKKKWIIQNDKRYLVKGASGVYRQEPFNELIANLVCQALDVPYVHYELSFIDQMPYSLCENFLSKDTELVSAWSVYSHFKKSNSSSSYQHLLDCYQKIGMQNPSNLLQKMLVLDFIIANTDRHMNNFGVVRNSNTLEIVGIAPIFDSGTSMDMSKPMRTEMTVVESKPFAKTQDEQIQLVDDLSWVDTKKLLDLQPKIAEILDQNPFLDSLRKEYLLQNYKQRVEQLEQMQQDKGAPSKSRNPFVNGIPANLQRDIDALEQGKKDKVLYVDCLLDELYGSINADFWAGIITKEQADYLRNKYLF